MVLFLMGEEGKCTGAGLVMLVTVQRHQPGMDRHPRVLLLRPLLDSMATQLNHKAAEVPADMVSKRMVFMFLYCVLVYIV